LAKCPDFHGHAQELAAALRRLLDGATFSRPGRVERRQLQKRWP
jgi:hypothetical protein